MPYSIIGLTDSCDCGDEDGERDGCSLNTSEMEVVVNETPQLHSEYACCEDSEIVFVDVESLTEDKSLIVDETPQLHSEYACSEDSKELADDESLTEKAEEESEDEALSPAATAVAGSKAAAAKAGAEKQRQSPFFSLFQPQLRQGGGGISSVGDEDKDCVVATVASAQPRSRATSDVETPRTPAAGLHTGPWQERSTIIFRRTHSSSAAKPCRVRDGDSKPWRHFPSILKAKTWINEGRNDKQAKLTHTAITAQLEGTRAAMPKGWFSWIWQYTGAECGRIVP